jgi:glycosyltransferase involved in cell wall biosynthesis
MTLAFFLNLNIGKILSIKIQKLNNINKKKVIFTDFIKDEEAPVLMAGAKVFVLPSFWEGFGIPIIPG